MTCVNNVLNVPKIRRSRVRVPRFVVVAATVSLWACNLYGCSGGDSGADGAVDTGLPSSASLAGLSDAERVKFCTRLDESFEEGIADALGSGVCLLGGHLSAAFDYAFNEDLDSAREACRRSVASCENDPESSEASEPVYTTDNSECEAVTKTCTATVGESEACMESVIESWTQQVASAPTCDELTVEYLINGSPSETDGSADDTPECNIVREKCPDAIDE